jgi:hypothetical protein
MCALLGGVDHEPPDPSLERALGSERPTFPNRLHEGVVDRVGTGLFVARDCGRDPQEAQEVRAVDPLELGDRRSSAELHRTNDPGRPSKSLVEAANFSSDGDLID